MTLEIRTRGDGLLAADRKEAEVFCFRFNDSFGWANFTLCEETGELSIQSDWGGYSYAWTGRGNLTLKVFLAQTNADYVLGKFSMGGKAPELADEFDFTATIRAIETAVDKWLLDQRKFHSTAARRKVAEAKKVIAAFTETSSLDEFLAETGDESNADLLWNLLEASPHDYIEMRKSARWKFMEEELWPFWTTWLRGYLAADGLMKGLVELNRWNKCVQCGRRNVQGPPANIGRHGMQYFCGPCAIPLEKRTDYVGPEVGIDAWNRWGRR